MSIKAIGIDVGSQTTKAVLLEDSRILSSSIILSNEEAEISAKAAVEQVLAGAGLTADGIHITSTGIGGKTVPFSNQHKSITTCLGRGVHFLLPDVRLAIDLGAESGTVIKLNDKGRLSDWATHDKCAAGTGLFLQQMAKLMLLTMEKMSDISLQSTDKADITSTCAVFAESEVISHVHRVPPTPMPDIAAGIYYSIVSRIITLCKRVGIQREVAAVGGVALNTGLVHILEEEMGFKIMVPEKPQLVAAIGAAIIARETIEKGAR
jgi:predicted CoA-substrate-specific enzyme activase